MTERLNDARLAEIEREYTGGRPVFLKEEVGELLAECRRAREREKALAKIHECADGSHERCEAIVFGFEEENAALRAKLDSLNEHLDPPSEEPQLGIAILITDLRAKLHEEQDAHASCYGLLEDARVEVESLKERCDHANSTIESDTWVCPDCGRRGDDDEERSI